MNDRTSKNANRIEEIAEKMQELVSEARNIAEVSGCNMANLDAYVFEQIEEHLHKENQYNQDLMDVAKDIRQLDN